MEETKYSMTMFGGSPLGNAEVSAFLWGSRLYLGLGYGMAFVSVKDSLGYKANKFVETVNYGFGLEYFFSSSIYAKLGVNATTLSPPIIKNEIFRSYFSQYAFIGVGYYLGTLVL